jgi:glycosyltransferase involved in cell wall biosynthesis
VKVLILSADVIKKTMAGPGIRCFEFARCLSSYFDVTLGIPNEIEIFPEKFIVKRYKEDIEDIKRMVEKADVLLVGYMDLKALSFLRKVNKPIIIDIYSPSNLETLEWHAHENLTKRIQLQEMATEIINNWIGLGDFFICASERQRSFWLGMLASNYRLLPNAYDEDKTFRNIIDVVPFGLPSTAPQYRKPALKGVVNGINKGDIVMIWGGGIWNWLDPITYIRAMAEISKERDDIKLFFMGKGHPNRKMPEMKMYNRALELSKELGVYQNTVFFNDGWVPYDERSNFLLESDIGVCGHFTNVETEFSFRTRVLDYLWTGLPIISTDGDEMANLVEKFGLGEVFGAENTNDLKKAILKLSDPEYRVKCKENISQISAKFSWENAVQPIIRYCQDPQKMEVRGCNPDSLSNIRDVKVSKTLTLDGRIRDLEKSVEDLRKFFSKITNNRIVQFLSQLKKKFRLRKQP